MKDCSEHNWCWKCKPEIAAKMQRIFSRPKSKEWREKLRKANELSTDSEFFRGGVVRRSDLAKRRLRRMGRPCICVLCGLGPEWNGKPMSLQLDHIDGDRKNWVLSNLRLLCANCHTQTPTYSWRNTAHA